MAGKRAVWKAIPGFPSYESNGSGAVRDKDKKKVELTKFSVLPEIDTYMLTDRAGHDEAITSDEIIRRTFPDKD